MADGIAAVLARTSRWHVAKGDNLVVLRDAPSESFDAVVTDAPYGLREIPAELCRQALIAWLAGEPFVPAGRGFAGRRWDAFVPGPETWREVFRVLKPGGYALVFASSRTQHLMGVSLQLAGFDIRDTLEWLYGTGFAKSANASKALDKARHGGREEVLRVTAWVRDRMAAAKLRPRQLDAACGTKGMASHWTTQAGQPLIPTAEQWAKLEPLLGAAPEWMVPLLLPARQPGPAWAKREVVESRGQRNRWWDTVEGREAKGDTFDMTSGATEQSRALESHGTALRPAHEPIIMARRPMVGTLAENLRAYGTGALDIDGCRTRPDADAGGSREGESSAQRRYAKSGSMGLAAKPGARGGSARGRSPSNVLIGHLAGCVHVGDIEVSAVEAGEDGALSARAGETELLEDWRCVEGCPAGALALQSGHLTSGAMAKGQQRGDSQGNAFGPFRGAAAVAGHAADEGSATRFYPQFPADGPEAAVPFYYVPKPSRKERHAGCYTLGGNDHPTIKPIALMRWLVRLVGGKGKVILDPFVGSGTTLISAGIEGALCVGIDADPHAVDIAIARARHWIGEPVAGELIAAPAPTSTVSLPSGPLFDLPRPAPPAAAPPPEKP